MKLPSKKSGVMSLLAVPAALALTLVSLPSCSGGGGDSDENAFAPNICPQQLVPSGATQSVLRIRGIHLDNTGWEIGSDEEDDVPQDGMSIERQLTMVFYADGPTSDRGSMDLSIPYANVVDNNDPPPREIDMTGGQWWQEKVSKQANTIMYINFRITGTIDANGTPGIYTGENICILLRERRIDETGGWRFDGAVMSGKLRLEADRAFIGGWGGDGIPHIYNTEKDMWGQPCTYIVAGGWAPEDAE